MSPECSISIRRSAELITATPFLIGFHPTDSIVVVGVAGRRIVFVARHDLPPPGEELDTAPLVATAEKQRIDCFALIGYGSATAVAGAVRPTILALKRAGLRVFEALRVAEGRWWSYLCPAPDCPSEGYPCPSPYDPLAAAAVYGGMVALPNRKALVARVAPVEGAAREAMALATARARVRAAELRAAELRAGRECRSVRRAGREAVRAAERRYRAQGRLADGEAAWLGVLLVDAVVLGYAFDRCGPEPWRIDLWNEMVRRMQPGLVAGPASLLAYTAWRVGDGALARVALDRGLREEPGHRMLVLIDGLLSAGIGPHMVEDLAPPPDRPARPLPRSDRPVPPRRRTEPGSPSRPRARDRRRVKARQHAGARPAGAERRRR
ncbi:hypothetical protein Ade02nite_76390 [Paractinoplanes deccanensis]|uniref:DUF4192 domain-containing protein n=1 Tax=Paractinoplanes deccanensis TaxID=113561 RepID=A0ABQ3YG49_9ACTN|nr:DUF4192 domain-containing protein [Actinoplanes deccanensis]GID78998.1 hypothetical protein Ade02nite_76390 [Actinoplanes deccanensis]